MKDMHFSAKSSVLVDCFSSNSLKTNRALFNFHSASQRHIEVRKNSHMLRKIVSEIMAILIRNSSVKLCSNHCGESLMKRLFNIKKQTFAVF